MSVSQQVVVMGRGYVFSPDPVTDSLGEFQLVHQVLQAYHRKQKSTPGESNGFSIVGCKSSYPHVEPVSKTFCQRHTAIRMWSLNKSELVWT